MTGVARSFENRLDVTEEINFTVSRHLRSGGEQLLLSRRRRCRLSTIGPNGAMIDPETDRRDLLFGERAAFWRHPHPQITVPEHALQQKTVCTISGDDR